MTKTLDDLRQEITAADDELIKVLAKRMDIVRKIGKLKKENNVSALDEKRWQEVLDKVLEAARKYSLPTTLVEKIYEEIHKTALEIENYE